MRNIKYYVWLLSFLILSFTSVFASGSREPTPNSSDSIPRLERVSSQSGTTEQLSNLFYYGDGGKGMSLTILAPKATGLSENQMYLPALVQGEFVSNFSGYSAMAVLDRQRLDEQYAELLSGYYDDDTEAGSDLGHLSPTDYILGGNITRTSTGYALQISITKSSDKMTVASYSGTCTFTELDNLVGVRRVSLDLLQKLGILPTELTKAELSGAAATNHISAQIALAQGITAQHSGSTVVALTYYSEAVSFKAGISEADYRLSVLSERIKSGNIAQNIRNDFQRREAWRKLLEEAVDFYFAYPIFDVVVNPTPAQGKTDYDNGTVELVYSIYLAPNSGFKSIFTVLTAYWDTGKAQEWNLDSIIKKMFDDKHDGSDELFIGINVQVDLLDSNGTLLANGEINRSSYTSNSYRDSISIRTRNGTFYPDFVLSGYYTFASNRDNNRRMKPNWPRAWIEINCLGPLITKELVFNIDINQVGDNMTLKFNGIQFGYISNYEWVYSQLVNTNFISSDKTLEQYFAGDNNLDVIRTPSPPVAGRKAYRFR